MPVVIGQSKWGSPYTHRPTMWNTACVECTAAIGCGMRHRSDCPLGNYNVAMPGFYTLSAGWCWGALIYERSGLPSHKLYDQQWCKAQFEFVGDAERWPEFSNAAAF